MSTFEGQALLVKLGDGADPEVFSHVCGINSTGISFTTNTNETPVFDCNDIDAPAVIEKIVSSKSHEISGSGLVDTESIATWMDFYDSGTAKNCVITIPNVGDYKGLFICTSLNLTAPKKDLSTIDITLSGTGKFEKVV